MAAWITKVAPMPARTVVMPSPCTNIYLTRTAPDTGVRYRKLEFDFVAEVEARIPVKNQIPPTPTPSPSGSVGPTPTPSPGTGPGSAGGPTTPDKVRLDDWQWKGAYFSGIPC
jgi:hypothetical protein